MPKPTYDERLDLMKPISSEHAALDREWDDAHAPWAPMEALDVVINRAEKGAVR